MAEAWQNQPWLNDSPGEHHICRLKRIWFTRTHSCIVGLHSVAAVRLHSWLLCTHLAYTCSSCARPPRLLSLQELRSGSPATSWIHAKAWFRAGFLPQLLPVEWSTGPPPLLLNKAVYRSGYAFSRATHRSRKWSLSLLIRIFKRWSTFSALDEQFWSSSNLSSWLRVPDTISSSITRSASVMDSNKFWWHWSSNSLCFGSIAMRCSSVASQLTQTAKWTRYPSLIKSTERLSSWTYRGMQKFAGAAAARGCAEDQFL